MKISFYLLILLLSYSCNNSTDLIEEPTEKKCFITKFNLVTIKLVGQEFFTSEYIYDSNKNLIKQLDFSIIQSGEVPGNPLPTPTYTTKLKSTTNIVYDSNNLPIKIIYEPDSYNKQKLENLLYTNGRLSSKEIILTNLNSNLSSKIKYKYYYDVKNRVISVVGEHYNILGALDLNENHAVVYDSNDNLQSVTISTATLENYKTTTILEYSKYDTFKNPFKGIQVPFEDYMYIRFSKNNYTKLTKKFIVDNSIYSQETEIFAYSYNENNYPTIAEYKCN